MSEQTDRKFVLCEYLSQVVKDKGVVVVSDTPLVVSGLLDSLQILGLIEFVESRFSIKFADEELIPENFGSVLQIEQLIVLHENQKAGE